MATPLAEKIKALIATNGPISVSDYFALCLADPEHGYYKTRHPFGRAGDFVTAPEISQLFGEMVGIFLVMAWKSHGEPDNARIVEIGPGRGTMMADILRVIERTAPVLYDTATVHLVETSGLLKLTQRETLQRHENKVHWHDSFDEVPEGFTLIAANELFDAIPIRQFIKTQAGFIERMVGLDEAGELTFTTGIAMLDASALPSHAKAQPDGSIFEFAPARQAVMMAICERLTATNGTALIIDYGHMVTGFGDTLQAVRAHDYDPPLAHPGFADLTSHVDFEHLARTALATGAHLNGCMRQGDFLVGLGIEERAANLGRGKDEKTQHDIVEAVHRLAGAGSGHMGELFKVLAVSSPAVHVPPFKAPG
ncbi:class I SAM-dependent methyltransferase [Peteryoungia desertarenae]|uniref:Class I SAM-dependent methyltransferase n=1 Tax=Peteryoungia desertarenae TaxID=1813451 RepID=A0ABX6QRQ7_9HYPH|nr:class I SAM-dependent methyltransferase [Peteryoungia desertarenae]QLF70951.1 class I SAM-dependent methyltransferase [Peteryoungia desertarenae]